MRNQIFVSLGILMMLSSNAFPSNSSDRQSDRLAIQAHIDAVFDAYIRKDREDLRKTHAENWRGFLSSSRQIIRGIDEYMQQAEPFLSSTYKIESYRILDMDIVFYGDIAFVSYIADLDLNTQGQVSHNKLRVVDLYVKSGGHWNQAGSQVDTHPDTLDSTSQSLQILNSDEELKLLAAREEVWRAWFANDSAVLQKVIPKEVIAINSGEETWSDLTTVLSSSRDSATSGTKLVKLEFPRTEIQVYGDVAILYSRYAYEVETKGKRQPVSGRATEVFVRRNGAWVNTGWHLDSEK
jgi:ketosteroid isomerase-like protein